jgi:hypothetical protein
MRSDQLKGLKGEGRAGIAPVLVGNSIFSLDDPYNAVAVVLRGLAPAYSSSSNDSYMPMVSFLTGNGWYRDACDWL